MKTLLTLLSLIIILSLTGCYTESIVGPTGPSGPQGPTGPAGADGESGYVFEWDNINFTAPNYEVVLPFPNNFEGLNSDIALVYLLWDDYTTNDGELVEVWRPLNQTLLTEDGTLMYKYDFSKYDARIFIEADYSRDFLGAIDTDNWVARVVIVPGEFWNSGRMDFSNYHELKEALGLPDMNPQRSRVAERRK